jgi:hypothetical protein
VQSEQLEATRGLCAVCLRLTCDGKSCDPGLEPLDFRPALLSARTHRGEYRVLVSPDREDRECAWASFLAYEGGCEMIEPPILGTVSKVKAACAEHAARQPAHPPMLGWPACGELEEASHV